MNIHQSPVPHLVMANPRDVHEIEQVILNHTTAIETWFRQKWLETPPLLTTSVDIRNAGFKVAPVDTNIFPAGFNNLNPDFLTLCIQAVQSTLTQYIPKCINILLIPENHTRNKFYMKSFNVLLTILTKAGFSVRIGSLDPEIHETVKVPVDDNGEYILLEPVQRQNDKLVLPDFNPCLVILNNDLSSGVPDILKNLKQPISPSPLLGWASRLKSTHFQFFSEVAQEFSKIINMDSWLIDPYFKAIDGVDFMAQEGMDALATEVDRILDLTRQKYKQYDIKHPAFVAVKADNGTYGMSVMMVQDGNELRQLNRKQRTKMSSIKGSQKVTRVIIQEGVYSFETMSDESVAEPVVYMLGQFVVGGFYRVHENRGINENLNAPGMYFEPLAFAKPCNTPSEKWTDDENCPNRFYLYGVIARLAALAAARESAALSGANV